MTRNFWLRELPIALGISSLVIVTTAWQVQPPKQAHTTTTDTIPDKKVRNIDDALQQLEKSKQELERALKEKNWEKEMKDALDKIQIDGEKIKIEIAAAMKDLDTKKIQLDIEKAMKEVDLDKMKIELQQNVEKIDMKEMKQQIEKAIKEIDVDKIKLDIDASISKIDLDKIKIELDKVKDIDLKQMEDQLKKIEPEIEKSIQSARESIEKAKTELLEHKNFINDLDKDGLIDKDKTYTIAYKKGELTINGKKQPAEVVKKYNGFLKDRKDFTIKKDNEDFKIDKE